MTLNKKIINNTLIIELENIYIDIETIYRSGQCFNIIKKDNVYKIISTDKLCVFKRHETKSEIYMRKDEEDYWTRYFNLNTDFKEYLDILKNDNNEFIKKCANYSTGMIILKQDLWECMMSFIISQRKSIPSIKTSLELLSEKFGQNHESFLENFVLIKYKSLPQLQDFNWFLKNKDKDEIINYLQAKNNKKEYIKPNISQLQELLSCGLGYRDEYILQAAEWMSRKPNISEGYDNHLNTLMKIKGIGKKVANCITLFSFNDFDAFPVDVWIQRILDKKLLPEDLSQYQKFLGFLQQIIFFYAIENKKEII